MSADNEPEDDEMCEQDVLEALQELREDGERQRVFDQLATTEKVEWHNSRHASITQDYLGLSAGESMTSELILGYDRVVWKMMKNDSGCWDLEEFCGYDEAISINLAIENVPWERLIELFNFCSPRVMADWIIESQQFDWMWDRLNDNRPDGVPLSHVFHDPILRKAMARFDE